MKNEIVYDETLVAYCGLYCGACPRYLQNKCNGCRENNHFPKHCAVKPCNIDNNYDNCAECQVLENIKHCKKFNPFLIKFGEFITGTSRKKCIEKIREYGKQEFAKYMVNNKLVSCKKKKI